MDVNSHHWPTYQAQFEALAEHAMPWQGKKPDLNDARLFLCLYADNGLSEADELAALDTLATQSPLYVLSIETAYWQDLILFTP